MHIGKLFGGGLTKKLFPLVYGNEGMKNRIGNAIIDGRAPHAFLVDGPRGSGKATLAVNIAAALNCEARSDGYSPLPCGKCDSCRKFLQAVTLTCAR